LDIRGERERYKLALLPAGLDTSSTWTKGQQTGRERERVSVLETAVPDSTCSIQIVAAHISISEVLVHT
jgi:deoxycytidylate deaminase